MILPSTRCEMQEAADAAHALLALESSRGFGLVTGGPVANVERCEEVLAFCASRGVTPRPRAIEEFVGELLAAAA